MQSEELKEKLFKNNLEKYGKKCTLQVESVNKKARQTCLKKYGAEYAIQSQDIKDKIKQTCLAKYGVEHFSQTEEFQKIRQLNYTYNNLSFDSSWELAFYIYYADHNFSITRVPCSFEYAYDNSTHKYFPDFKIQNRLFEIKGAHFFNDEGELINSYDSSKNDKAAAKHKCMLENNVVIITDCSKYLDYVNSKYGKDFLKSCRTENAEAV